ncbi:MAG: inner membrane CreD family protein [Moraxellaceae bacterium]|nr:inner membrane CreD family protein [Moraxellaceae bacterium]
MILQSEDFTLILGSVLVFILIAVMMFLTPLIRGDAEGRGEM